MMKTIVCDGKKLSPSKIICIGRNYVAHIQELDNDMPDEPVIFLKPNSAIAKELNTHPRDEIHYEAEICLLIRKNKITAIGIGLDLTKRQIQDQLKSKGLPWERSKAFDNSAVFSEFKSFKGDLSQLRLELFINDQLIQQGTFELMLFKPERIIEDVSAFMCIEDNDVIMTGTPKGVGVVNQGDVFIGKVFEGDKLITTACWEAR